MDLMHFLVNVALRIIEIMKVILILGKVRLSNSQWIEI